MIRTRSASCKQSSSIIKIFQKSRSTEFLSQISSIQIDAPQGESIQQYSSSNEVRYLSHVGHSWQMSDDSSNSQIKSASYWMMLYRCVIYVRKQQIRTTTDDNLLNDDIQQYFRNDKLQPVPLNPIGTQLMHNGYFFIAYTIMQGRRYQSAFIFRFLLRLFIQESQSNRIYQNQEQFNQFIVNVIEKSQQNFIGITHFNSNMLIHQQQYATQVIKRNNISEQSDTIKLSDNNHQYDLYI